MAVASAGRSLNSDDEPKIGRYDGESLATAVGNGRFHRMPRFYFHLFNDLDVRDEEGVELPDEAAALEQAIRNARVIAAESVCEGRLVLNHRIEIMDANGAAVATVRFGDAVDVQE